MYNVPLIIIAETASVVPVLLSSLDLRRRKYLHRNWNPGQFLRVCDHYLRSLVTEPNKQLSSTILRSCLVSELQKLSLLGLEDDFLVVLTLPKSFPDFRA